MEKDKKHTPKFFSTFRLILKISLHFYIVSQLWRDPAFIFIETAYLLFSGGGLFALIDLLDVEGRIKKDMGLDDDDDD